MRTRAGMTVAEDVVSIALEVSVSDRKLIRIQCNTPEERREVKAALRTHPDFVRSERLDYFGDGWHVRVI
jgi:hypothetical protein